MLLLSFEDIAKEVQTEWWDSLEGNLQHDMLSRHIEEYPQDDTDDAYKKLTETYWDDIDPNSQGDMVCSYIDFNELHDSMLRCAGCGHTGAVIAFDPSGEEDYKCPVCLGDDVESIYTKASQELIDFVVRYARANQDHLKDMREDDIDKRGKSSIPTEKELLAGGPGAVALSAEYAIANIEELETMREEDIEESGRSTIPEISEILALQESVIEGRNS